MTPLEIEALKNELENDPLGLGYKHPSAVWKSDWTTLDLINADGPNHSRPAPIKVRKLLRWAASKKVLRKLKQAADTAAPGQDAAMAGLMLLQNVNATLDVSDPDTTGLINDLETEGVITAAQKAEIVALASEPASRAEKLFGRKIQMRNVESARALREGRVPANRGLIYGE